MKLLVLSDSHGDIHSLEKVIEMHNDANAILFLGDGERDFSKLDIEIKPSLYIVSGNCDFCSFEPTVRMLNLGGKKIMMTHGHEYKVKYSPEYLINNAKEKGIDIVLYGHTHTPDTRYGDINVMNPGSLSRHGGRGSTYGLIDITQDGQIFLNVAKLK